MLSILLSGFALNNRVLCVFFISLPDYKLCTVTFLHHLRYLPRYTTVSETGQALPSWGFCPDREQAPTREEGVNGTLGGWQALGISRGLRWVDVVESEGVAGPITPQEF